MANIKVDTVSDPEHVPYVGKRTPERNLLSSILGFALCDLQENRSEETRRQAYYYLMGEGVFGKDEYHEYPFLVENICQELDLCVIALRQVVKRMFTNPAEFRIRW